ncbi:MAG: YgjV family protein, partial [Pseudomonadota bacterium]
MDFLANIFSAYENPFSFYQLVAWIGVVLYVLSFQVFDTRKTLAMWIPANLSFALHFYGLESLPAMFVALGSAVRETSAVFLQKKIFHIILVLNLIFNAFIAYIYFSNVFSL